MGSRTVLLVAGMLALLACPTFGNQRQPEQSTSMDLESRITSSAVPNCFIRCSFPPTRSQHELDTIAKDITNQVISEMRSGQLSTQQLNKPYFFERRVSQQLNELNKDRQSVQVTYPQLGYGDERLLRERNQQSLDLQRQIHSNIFNRGQSAQRQVQQQGTQFQQQSQNHVQHIYNVPAPTTREESSRIEERQRVVINNPVPQPVATISQSQIRKESSANEVSRRRRPLGINGQQQVYRQEEQRRSEVRQQQHSPAFVVPTAETRIVTRHDESRETSVQNPVVRVQPTSTYREYYNNRQQVERYQQKPRIFVPSVVSSRNTSSTVQTNGHIIRPPVQMPSAVREYERNEQQIHRTQDTPRPVVVQVRPPTIHKTVETSNSRYESVVPPSRILLTPASEQEQYYRREERFENRVRSSTVRPVLVQGRHSIYRHLQESSEGFVPNYNPRVTLNQNVDVLQQRVEQQYDVQPRPDTSSYTRRIENLRSDLQHYRIQPFPLHKLNTTVQSGQFVEGNRVYIYNVASGHFQPTGDSQQTVSNSTHYTTTTTETRHLEPTYNRPYERLSQVEYERRLVKLDADLERLGYTNIRDEMRTEIVQRGGFQHNGVVYVYQNDRFVRIDNGSQDQDNRETTHRVESQSEAYERKSEELRSKLQQIQVADFDEFERNQTLGTGVFIRGGAIYKYNAQTHNYDSEILSEGEITRIYQRIQQLLRHYGYRQASRNETQAMLDNGLFYRAGHRWVYESTTGMLTQTQEVDQFQELTQEDYQRIYDHIQQTLSRLGYERMEEIQCNSTIVTGKFEKGGIVYIFDAERGTFERVELSEQVFNERLRVLGEKLIELGHRELSAEELRSIINRGYFLFENNRYEYNAMTGRYEQILMTDEDYQGRLEHLQQQLQEIGYTHMSLFECNTTIYSGQFYYNGYDWLYNYDTDLYERSNVPTASKPEYPEDENQYGVVATEPTPEPVTEAIPDPSTESTKPSERPIISQTRGDLPPQVYKDDYEEEEEVVEQEPGVGYYSKPTESPVSSTRVVHDNAAPEVELDQQRDQDEERQRLEDQRRQAEYSRQLAEHAAREKQRQREEQDRLVAEQEQYRVRLEEERRVEEHQRTLQQEQERQRLEQQQQEHEQELERERIHEQELQAHEQELERERINEQQRQVQEQQQQLEAEAERLRLEEQRRIQEQGQVSEIQEVSSQNVQNTIRPDDEEQDRDEDREEDEADDEQEEGDVEEPDDGEEEY